MVERLALVDIELARRVTVGLGLPAPIPVASGDGDGDSDGEVVPDATGGLDASPSLAMITQNAYPVDGRIVQILANDGCDLAGIRALQTALIAAGAVPHVVAAHKGAIAGKRKADELTVDRSFHTASPAEADAFVVADGAALADNPAAITWIQSAYRHFKPIAAWGDGNQLLTNAGIASDAPGIFVAPKANSSLAKAVLAALAAHRAWDRAATHPTRTAPKEA
jgi:catalase